MLNFTSLRSFGSAAALCVLLTACGGGGGTEPPPPPPPPAGATEISTDNMNAVAAASIASASTADFATELKSFGLVGSPAASGVIAAALQQITATLASAAAGPVVAARITPPPELALTPVAPPEVLLPIGDGVFPCENGGSFTLAIWDKNQNGQADPAEPFRFKMNACKEGNETLNGGLDLYVYSLTQANGVATSADLRADFSWSIATTGGRSNYLFGTLGITMTTSSGRATTVIQGTPGWTQIEGERFLSVVHDSYQASVSEQASGGSIVDFSSAATLRSVGITRPIENTLLTRTTTPIALAADGSIVSGSMRITAQGKPAVLDVSIANGVATLDLDADGNGSVDTTRNLTLLELAKLF